MSCFKKLSFTFLLAAGAQFAAASPIVITQTEIASRAQQAFGFSAVKNSFNGTAATASGSVTASVPGSYAITTYDWAASPTAHSFDFGMEHQIATDYAALAQTFQSSVIFTAIDDAVYSLDGLYDATGDSRVYFRVLLQDLVTGALLFDNAQESRVTLDETFALGEAGGDEANQLTGNLSGNLEAGGTYAFFMYSFIQQAPGAGSVTATADGFVSFDVRSVPAPASLGLFLVGLLILCRRPLKSLR